MALKFELYGAADQVEITQSLIDAVNHRQHMVIGYKNEVRLIQPHAVGKVGKVRAYQLYPEVGWRMFDIAKISIDKFEPAPLYVKGDKTLSEDGILAEV